MKRLRNVGMIFTVIAALIISGCSQQTTDADGSQEQSAEEQPAREQAGEEKEKPAQESGPIELEFYYPVSVGGALSEKIESYANAFNQEHEGEIKVNPVFAGNYTDTLTKVKTAIESGNAPDLAILLQTDIFDLTDLDYVEPLDPYIEEAGSEYIEDFYPALLQGSEMNGKRYSLPFQRSTQVLYYNKEIFAEENLENVPDTWDELVEIGQALVERENGEVTRWGLQVPMGGLFSYWNIQPFILQNGVELANPEGTEVRLDDPKTIEAVQFFYDLAHVHEIMPKGPQGWGPRTF